MNLASFLGNVAIYHREHANYGRAAVLIEEAFVVAEHLGDAGDIADLYSHRSTLRLYQGEPGRRATRPGGLCHDGHEIGQCLGYPERNW